MEKKGQVGTQTVLLTTLIVTLIAVSVSATLITNNTATTDISNDEFTALNNTCVAVSTNCLTELTAFSNGTQNWNVGNFSICPVSGDNVGIYLDGSNVDQKELSNLVLNASYTERSCSFIGGTTGTLINYIPLIMAVVIVAFLAMMIK